MKSFLNRLENVSVALRSRSKTCPNCGGPDKYRCGTATITSDAPPEGVRITSGKVITRTEEQGAEMLKCPVCGNYPGKIYYLIDDECEE